MRHRGCLERGERQRLMRPEPDRTAFPRQEISPPRMRPRQDTKRVGDESSSCAVYSITLDRFFIDIEPKARQLRRDDLAILKLEHAIVLQNL